MLDAILRPKSIAVVGASRQPDTIGYQILDNLVRWGFKGPVYPVNPGAVHIHSIPAYPSVSAIPGPVDLAVIVVRKQHVLAIAEECGRKGVKGLVVITAGFAEVGGEGIERERQLVEIVTRYGMRMVGPNCMGVLNTDPAVSLLATFAPKMPPHGPVAIVSQSGAMGQSILDYGEELGIGIYQFVSVGNKPNVSGNDLLEYWADDPNVKVILMYLESFGNPRRFAQIARKLTRRKPIFVVKAGRTAAGARAASSHTAALAGTDLAADVLMQQCGVIRAQTVEELFDYAMAFPRLPLPKGNRVAIISNAGGPAIILADACESSGLAVPELAPQTQAAIRARVAEEASVRNPVDLIASAKAAVYREVIKLVLGDPNVDAVIASFVASWHSAQAAAGWLLTGRSAHQRGLSSWVRPITSTDREAVTVRMNRPTVASSATTRAALIRIDTAPPGRHLPAAPRRIRRVPIKSTDMAVRQARPMAV